MKNLQGKTILLTGGTGFVGKALCSALSDRGAHTVVLSRKTHPAQKLISFIKSLDEIKNTTIDIIINLAGEPIAQRWTARAKAEIHGSRIKITSSIVDFIKSATHKPSLLVSGSAIGYYGTDPDMSFDETTRPADGAAFSRTLCTAWENEAKKAEAFDVRTVLLRIGAVLEKDGGMLAKLLPAFRFGLGGPIGHGRQWLSWIDRDDLVKLILHIIDNNNLTGPINATAPRPVTNAQFSEALAQTLNRPCVLRTPAIVLRAAFGDMADEIMLQGQNVLPKKAIEAGFAFSYPELHLSLQKILQCGTAKHE